MVKWDRVDFSWAKKHRIRPDSIIPTYLKVDFF